MTRAAALCAVLAGAVLLLCVGGLAQARGGAEGVYWLDYRTQRAGVSAEHCRVYFPKRRRICRKPARYPRSEQALSPDGRWLAETDQTRNFENNGIFLYPTRFNNGPRRPVIYGAPFAYGEVLTWSPDGDWLAVAVRTFRVPTYDIYRIRITQDGLPNCYRDDDCVQRQMENGWLVRLTDSPVADITPAWSPDGKWILFSSFRDSWSVRVFAVPAAGGEPILLNDDLQHMLSPQWSPDGEWILFRSDCVPTAESLAKEICDRTAYNLFVMSFHNPDRWRRLTNSFTDNFRGTWSPDGRWIAFSARETITSKLHVYIIRPMPESENNPRIDISAATEGGRAPIWSPMVNKPWRGGWLFGMGGLLVALGMGLAKRRTVP